MSDNRWNISEEAIAAALRDGTSPDELAKAFAAKLNAAITKQKEATQKYKDAECVVNFLTTYYGDFFEGLTVDIVLQSLDKIVATIGPITTAIEEAGKYIDKKLVNNKEKIPKPASTPLSLEDLLNMFGE